MSNVQSTTGAENHGRVNYSARQPRGQLLADVTITGNLLLKLGALTSFTTGPLGTAWLAGHHYLSHCFS